MGKDFDQNIYKKAHNVTPNVYPGPAKPGNEVSFCLLFLKNPLNSSLTLRSAAPVWRCGACLDTPVSLMCLQPWMDQQPRYLNEANA